MRRIALVSLVLALAGTARAQELDCEVTLARQALSGSEFAYLDDLRDAIERYLARSWTDDVFEADERIDCQFQITLTAAPTQSTFEAQLAVQARRPVYGTAQRTTTVLLSDSWAFAYTRGQNLVYDPNRFDSLTSLLDFYANLILGYDYDSFAPAGGTPYFERARRIAELARSTGAGAGWGGDLGDDRSRYTLVQELLDPTFAPLRAAHYAYHFTVLDHFVPQPQVAWADAVGVMEALHELFVQFNRRRYATDVFFAAKHQEITDLFRDAPQRNAVYALLSEMDAARLSTYDALVRN